MPDFMPHRQIGRTGFAATAIGIGDLADRSMPIETCVATARRALDAGLNVIDTAPNYENGYSEEIVGRAVREVKRDSLFVIDKIDHHEQPVGPQIDGSLARLRLDHADLFVFHDLSSLDAFEQLWQVGGGFDQLADAVKAGKCRFRGISSHNPFVLGAALAAGVCDVVMFPLGPFVDPFYVNEILPRARSLGVGTVSFKTFGSGKLLGDTTGYNQPLKERPHGVPLPRLTVTECVHYTLTLDADVMLMGLNDPHEQDAAFAAAKSFRPLPAEQMNDIRERAAEARKHKGPCWWNPDPQA